MRGQIDRFLSIDGAGSFLANVAVGSRRYRITFKGPGGHSFAAFGTANPIQAAITSALTFIGGAALPLLAAIFTTGIATTYAVSVVSLLVMAVLGALGSWTGGSPLWKGALRVAFWGALAMAVTAGVGALFGTVAG